MSERYFRFQIAVLVILILLILALFSGIFLWERVFPQPYQLSQPVIQPASTPADNAELTTRVENLENEQNFNLKVFEWNLDQKLIILGGVAFLISLAAGVIGIKSYNDLDRVINEEVRRALDQALYQLDPTNLQIWVVAREEEQLLFNPKTKKEEVVRLDVEMRKIEERLLLSGLPNIGTLEKPDKKCYRGVTIVPVFNAGMENQFRSFLRRNKSSLDKERAAFVLYTQTHQVEKDTLLAYPNLATANMPATAASMVLTVGRGLKNTKPQKEKVEAK